MEVPDHSTVAEFRRRHQDLIAELFVEVLGLCAEAGLVELGEISVDGTKLRASASYDRNRGYVSIVEEILGEAEQADRAEDERLGDRRGDEVPEALRTREGRRAALQAAKERMQAQREAQLAAGEQVINRVELDLDPDRFVTRPEGRQAWLREGRGAVERARDADPRPVPRDRRQRIVEVRQRFDQELAFQHAANRAYEHYRQTGRMRNGRRFGAPPHPFVPPLVPEGKINTTDPDSGVMIQKGQPPMQGYSAQAAVTTGQIVIAAEVVTSAPDYGRLNRSCTPRCATSPGRGRPNGPSRCSPTRATGMPNRCNDRRRRDAGARSRPTAVCAKARGPGWEAALRVHAPRPGHRHGHALYGNARPASSRSSARSKHNRRARPLPTTRQSRRPVRVAADHRLSQPAQAPQPLDHTRYRVISEHPPAHHQRAPANHRSPSELYPTASGKCGTLNESSSTQHAHKQPDAQTGTVVIAIA